MEKRDRTEIKIHKICINSICVLQYKVETNHTEIQLHYVSVQYKNVHIRQYIEVVH